MSSNVDVYDVPQMPELVLEPKPKMLYGMSMISKPTEPRPELNSVEIMDKTHGWTEEDENMLLNWADTLKKTSFSYQYLLDKSFKISTRLSLISVCSSSLLSIFAGFKLWIQDNRVFQSAGDIVMLFSNFLIAAITTASKRYLDDQKNQKIKAYLEEADKFHALIYTQINLAPSYRMPPKDFFNLYKEQYTQIMTNMPNVSIREITIAQQKYKEFERVLKENDTETVRVDIGTMTEGNTFTPVYRGFV